MNLEKKLKEFEESCLRLASLETEALKGDIQAEIEEQMKKELDEYTQKKEWSFGKTTEKLEKDYMKEIFNFQTECKKDILKAKQDIDNDLRKKVIGLLEEYTNSSEYENFLFNCVDSAIKNSKGSSNVSIGITQKDLQKYESNLKQKYNIDFNEINNCYIGGCILKSNEIYIDNTLLNSLEEKMKEEKE